MFIIHKTKKNRKVLHGKSVSIILKSLSLLNIVCRIVHVDAYIKERSTPQIIIGYAKSYTR